MGSQPNTPLLAPAPPVTPRSTAIFKTPSDTRQGPVQTLAALQSRAWTRTPAPVRHGHGLRGPDGTPSLEYLLQAPPPCHSHGSHRALYVSKGLSCQNIVTRGLTAVKGADVDHDDPQAPGFCALAHKVIFKSEHTPVSLVVKSCISQFV